MKKHIFILAFAGLIAGFGPSISAKKTVNSSTSTNTNTNANATANFPYLNELQPDVLKSLLMSQLVRTKNCNLDLIKAVFDRLQVLSPEADHVKFSVDVFFKKSSETVDLVRYFIDYKIRAQNNRVYDKCVKSNCFGSSDCRLPLAMKTLILPDSRMDGRKKFVEEWKASFSVSDSTYPLLLEKFRILHPNLEKIFFKNIKNVTTGVFHVRGGQDVFTEVPDDDAQVVPQVSRVERERRNRKVLSQARSHTCKESCSRRSGYTSVNGRVTSSYSHCTRKKTPNTPLVPKKRSTKNSHRSKQFVYGTEDLSIGDMQKLFVHGAEYLDLRKYFKLNGEGCKSFAYLFKNEFLEDWPGTKLPQSIKTIDFVWSSRIGNRVGDFENLFDYFAEENGVCSGGMAWLRDKYRNLEKIRFFHYKSGMLKETLVVRNRHRQ